MDPAEPGGGGRFRVSVAKDYLTFSAAHFITIPGHKCEALHGHNYVVQVAVEGQVDRATGFVVDFAVLKRILRPAIDAIDHRVILPSRNDRVRIRTEAGRTIVDYGGHGWFVFPESNVALVPVTDTTAELLAEYLVREVVRGLSDEQIAGVRTVTVLVEESPGQIGAYSASIDSQGGWS
jgi:6-pyruvoyltetrahydropterin/6-carboxytetrahydropterin synthase